MIRSNPLIQGIDDEKGVTHKISLFTDDVLLYITNPLDSIPVLMNSFRNYGELSGYKINQTKSEAVMIVGSWSPHLDKIAPFHWARQGFRYLGIILTPRNNRLYQANYEKLIVQIKSDIARWEISPLSLLGRIQLIRMNVLPRFLFQSLPIQVPASTFRMLDKLLSKYIWQMKKPRVRLKTLLLPKYKGGLGLPNLKKILLGSPIMDICTLDLKGFGWVQIEQNSIPEIPL